MCNIVLNNAEKIKFTPGELFRFVREVVRTAIEEHHGEYMTRGEAIELLGSRNKLEEYVKLGIINPIKGSKNQKWKLLTSEVLTAKRIKDKQS